MVQKIDKHGNLVELTAEEETQRQARETAYIAKQEAKVAADAQKATDKANAKAKLIAGEALTQAEADTIVIQIVRAFKDS